MTIESMLHEEASERLGSIFMLSGLPLDEDVNERQARGTQEADQVFETFLPRV